MQRWRNAKQKKKNTVFIMMNYENEVDENTLRSMRWTDEDRQWWSVEAKPQLGTVLRRVILMWCLHCGRGCGGALCKKGTETQKSSQIEANHDGRRIERNIASVEGWGGGRGGGAGFGIDDNGGTQDSTNAGIRCVADQGMRRNATCRGQRDATRRGGRAGWGRRYVELDALRCANHCVI